MLGEYVDNGTRGFLIQNIYILDFMLLLNYQFSSKQVYILSGTLGNLIFFFRNHFGHFIGLLVPGTCFLKIAFFSKNFQSSNISSRANRAKKTHPELNLGQANL